MKKPRFLLLMTALLRIMSCSSPSVAQPIPKEDSTKRFWMECATFSATHQFGAKGYTPAIEGIAQHPGRLFARAGVNTIVDQSGTLSIGATIGITNHFWITPAYTILVGERDGFGPGILFGCVYPITHRYSIAVSTECVSISNADYTDQGLNSVPTYPNFFFARGDAEVRLPLQLSVGYSFRYYVEDTKLPQNPVARAEPTQSSWLDEGPFVRKRFGNYFIKCQYTHDPLNEWDKFGFTAGSFF